MPWPHPWSLFSWWTFGTNARHDLALDPGRGGVPSTCRSAGEAGTAGRWRGPVTPVGTVTPRNHRSFWLMPNLLLQCFTLYRTFRLLWHQQDLYHCTHLAMKRTQKGDSSKATQLVNVTTQRQVFWTSSLAFEISVVLIGDNNEEIWYKRVRGTLWLVPVMHKPGLVLLKGSRA